MEYLWIRYSHDEEDEPSEVYSELDRDRMEVRKVEFFKNGMCFSYGAERGNEEALRQEPFPTDLRQLSQDGTAQVQTITRGHFQEVWNQAQERPDGFMGMFY